MIYANTDIKIKDSVLNKIKEKKERLDQLRPLSNDSVKKILEDIRLRHTYHSDAIEGNTLTLQETKIVIEEGITIGGKPLKDHMEARNDAEAFDLMIEMVNKRKKVTQEAIQRIHETVMKGIIENAGSYRTDNVRITGAPTTPPSYTKIISLMDKYIHNLNNTKLHPIKKASFIHHELSRIHPFQDGNGRVIRLVTNLFLMGEGYPPIVLKKEDRPKYYKTLRLADKGNLSPFADFIAIQINEGLMYYLSSLSKGEELISLKEISKFAPHSQEYLSLRARQGELDAVKIDNMWYSSKRAIKEYLKRME